MEMADIHRGIGLSGPPYAPGRQEAHLLTMCRWESGPREVKSPAHGHSQETPLQHSRPGCLLQRRREGEGEEQMAGHTCSGLLPHVLISPALLTANWAISSNK